MMIKTCWFNNRYKKSCIYLQYFNVYRRLKKGFYVQWSKQLKDQLVFFLSSFVHNSSINEHKNMKLRENNCYEIVNRILHYCGFRN